jgi:hypothetical protein
MTHRRKNHCLSLMHKIQNKLSPPYLQNCCPTLTRDRTLYNLHSNMNITTPQQRTTTYQKSFFPQTIKDWNDLDKPTRLLPSNKSFKEFLKKSTGFKTNKLYHHDMSKSAISHTRMRLGLSGLSAHRHDYHHIDNPQCPTCGAKTEDLSHYFLICPTFATHRPILIRETCNILHYYGVQIYFLNCVFREYFISTLLNGSTTMNTVDNKTIFNLVQNCIHESHRFP